MEKKSASSRLAELLGPPKMTQKEMYEFILERHKVLRIIPDHLDNLKIVGNNFKFEDKGKDFITSQGVRLNKILNDSFDEIIIILGQYYSSEDRVISIIKDIIKMQFESEIKYQIINEFYYLDYIRGQFKYQTIEKINGYYLNYEIKENSMRLNEDNISSYLKRFGNEIGFFLKLNNKKYDELQKLHNDLESRYQDVNRELAVSHDLNKKLRNDKKLLQYYQRRPSKIDIQKAADSYRFKSSNNINYTKVAEKFGVTNHTAKSWCDSYQIK